MTEVSPMAKSAGVGVQVMRAEHTGASAAGDVRPLHLEVGLQHSVDVGGRRLFEDGHRFRQ